MYKNDYHNSAIYYKSMGYFLLEISFYNVFMINYYFMLCSEICNGDFYVSSLFFNNEFINSAIKTYLEKNLREYNNIKYAYAIMSKRNPADFAIISNRTEWFEFYTANNYQFIDPVLITASHRVTPFSWDENIVIRSGLKLPKIFDMAKNYNVINGYTLVLHDHNNNLVVLSLIMDDSCDENIEESIKENQHKLQMLLITAHDKLTALYHELNNTSDFDKVSQKSCSPNAKMRFFTGQAWGNPIRKSRLS